MSLLNLTPHGIQVYTEAQFVNLEQINPTTWVADSVDGDPILALPSVGCARILTRVVDNGSTLGNHGFGCPLVEGCVAPIVSTEYGDATGIPEDVTYDDVLIVSLPMQSMAKSSGHPLAGQMVAPYKVVRSRANGSIVLGCMGFTY